MTNRHVDFGAVSLWHSKHLFPFAKRNGTTHRLHLAVLLWRVRKLFGFCISIIEACCTSISAFNVWESQFVSLWMSNSPMKNCPLYDWTQEPVVLTKNAENYKFMLTKWTSLQVSNFEWDCKKIWHGILLRLPNPVYRFTRNSTFIFNSIYAHTFQIHVTCSNSTIPICMYLNTFALK